MPAIGKNDDRLVGKLLVCAAPVVISAGCGYWLAYQDAMADVIMRATRQ